MAYNNPTAVPHTNQPIDPTADVRAMLAARSLATLRRRGELCAVCGVRPGSLITMRGGKFICRACNSGGNPPMTDNTPTDVRLIGVWNNLWLVETRMCGVSEFYTDRAFDTLEEAHAYASDKYADLVAKRTEPLVYDLLHGVAHD